MSGSIQPVRERITVLDVLRGFALFGVLLVNMLDFSGSALRDGTLGVRGSAIDQIVDITIVFFAVTKFYLLFSFLFGVGFAVQMRRTEDGGRPFVGFYLRRLGVLLLIGLAHSILLWDGDILRLYALAGLLLLVVRRLPTRALLGMALAIGLVGLLFFGAASDPQQLSTLMDPTTLQLYTQGSYGDLVQHRLNEQIVLDIQIPMVLVMFLLGLVVGREGLLDQPDRYRPFLRHAWLWALPVGLIGNGLLLAGYTLLEPWMISVGLHIGAPALSLVYASAVLLNADRLGWLASVGQTALSSYLTHSLLCTMLFYGYGFGLYNQLSPLATLGLVVLIFAAQVLISRWWVERFRFGPMEWLWRSLTYGTLQPLRRPPASVAPASPSVRSNP